MSCVAVVEERQHVAVGRQSDEAIGVDERDPEVAGRVEGEAVRDRAEVRRTVDLACAHRAVVSTRIREIRRAFDSTT